MKIFLNVREKFEEIKDKVSLVKTYPELHVISPGIAMRIEEFEELLGHKPELIYESKEKVYGISVVYTVDDEVTTGIIAHEFAEILAREIGISNHEEVDEICVKRGFGRELMSALQSVLAGRTERIFVDKEELERRIIKLRMKLNNRL